MARKKSIILTLSYVKIEEGNVATSFVVTEDYLMNVYNEMVENNDARIQDITIITSNGEKITERLSNTESGIDELIKKYDDTYAKYDEVNRNLSIVGNELGKLTAEGSYLDQIQKSIDLHVGKDEPSPYIEIKTASAEQSFSTKITDSQIGFYQNNATLPVAYLSSDGLMVYQAQFLNSFNIGNLRVSITENGVGFNW